MAELVNAVRALIDASGAQRLHLLGHDWRATVAWAVAAEIAAQLASLSGAVGALHPAAFLKALAISRQR
jgi:pimeloyl-ACP methyl ester carboxylesterase